MLAKMMQETSYTADYRVIEKRRTYHYVLDPGEIIAQETSTFSDRSRIRRFLINQVNILFTSNDGDIWTFVAASGRGPTVLANGDISTKSSGFAYWNGDWNSEAPPFVRDLIVDARERVMR